MSCLRQKLMGLLTLALLTGSWAVHAEPVKIRAGWVGAPASIVPFSHRPQIAKQPDGKILIPGVVSHATNVVEHPELVADRILAYANIVGRENVIAGTDCGLGGRMHSQIAWAKLRTLVEGARLASAELWHN